ncbi:hypothetical protein [Collinsella tanakaei]|uniref:hypothetical protein n=1 Tax=Collinsella tanakaei TaxID=626935 RepID=UPI0025A40010|nr:hypothetical protein [Collinsella tanakaei]MDM8301478.1 hypothetical protein [Collinsella tanakaei]
MNENVTRNERLLIQWYYAMVPLAQRGFRYIIVVMAEFLLLSMLDDLVFHNPGMYLGGLIAMLAIVIAFTFVKCYALLASRVDLNRRTWNSVTGKARAARRRKTEVAQDDDLDDGKHRAKIGRRGTQSVFTFREDTDGLMRAAWRIAEPLGIPLPDPKRFRRVVLAAALVLLAAVYVPHYIGRAATMQRQTEVAAQTTRAIAASFEEAGLDTFAPDPTDEHEKVSYYVTGDIVDEMGTETGSVRVDVDNAGRVIEVWYSIDLDPAASAADNLAHIESDLALMHGAVEAAEPAALVPGLVTAGELPREFEDAFIAADMKEGFSLDHHDVESAIVDDAELRFMFVAGAEDTWDGSDECYVSLTVEVDDEFLMESLPR